MTFPWLINSLDEGERDELNQIELSTTKVLAVLFRESSKSQFVGGGGYHKWKIMALKGVMPKCLLHHLMFTGKVVEISVIFTLSLLKERHLFSGRCPSPNIPYIGKIFNIFTD